MTENWLNDEGITAKIAALEENYKGISVHHLMRQDDRFLRQGINGNSKRTHDEYKRRRDQPKAHAQ